MTTHRFPDLDPDAIVQTREALHAYARVLGDWLKSARDRRKHWWHASLRPSLIGLTTGVVHADPGFELELDLVSSSLHVRTKEKDVTETLHGQSAADVASWLDEVLVASGVDAALRPGEGTPGSHAFPGYAATQAAKIHGALASVSAALEVFRARIREETSPIQVWPHHFDLSMIWLPGPKVPGQDPGDEEYSDKQMNFGFVFGDDTLAEPYLYVTAYPLPEAMPRTELPEGTNWRSDGFSGAVLLYKDLAGMSDPDAYLQEIWSTLLGAGQVSLASDEK
jgi:hypothetical protein